MTLSSYYIWLCLQLVSVEPLVFSSSCLNIIYEYNPPPPTGGLWVNIWIVVGWGGWEGEFSNLTASSSKRVSCPLSEFLRSRYKKISSSKNIKWPGKLKILEMEQFHTSIGLSPNESILSNGYTVCTLFRILLEIWIRLNPTGVFMFIFTWIMIRDPTLNFLKHLWKM